jgi:hypothetical protein
MLTTRTSDHIRTSNNIRGPHSCRTATGFPLLHLDARRLFREDAALATRNLRRAWLDHLWNRHQGWCSRLRRA